MKTLTVTIVAAWIKADTRVGPSIASGDQVCDPICADFPTKETTPDTSEKAKEIFFQFAPETIGSVDRASLVLSQSWDLSKNFTLI
jgi:hypothetical protein